MSPEHALRLLSEPRQLASHLKELAATVRKDALDKPMEQIPYLRGLVHGLESAAEEILRLVDLSRPREPEPEITLELEEELPVGAVVNMVELRRRGVDQG